MVKNNTKKAVSKLEKRKVKNEINSYAWKLETNIQKFCFYYTNKFYFNRFIFFIYK